MKKLQLVFFTGICALFSGCCECPDDLSLLKVEFKNYSTEDLKSVYILSEDRSDTCFTCVDTATQTGYIFANSYTTYQVKSDSIPLQKSIQVNKIQTETTRHFKCNCTNITGINYEYEGGKYTNEPIVITK